MSLVLSLKFMGWACVRYVEPGDGADSDTGTSNVTYYVECDVTTDAIAVTNRAGQQPFFLFDSTSPITTAGSETIAKKGSSSTVFSNSIGIVVDDASQNEYTIGTYVDRSTYARWYDVNENISSSKRPLIGIAIAAYDQEDSYSNYYYWPASDSAHAYVVLGESRTEFADEDANQQCPCTSKGNGPWVIIYAGTGVKYSDDSAAYVRKQKHMEISELKDLERITEYAIAHELCHVFGIPRTDDHHTSDSWCVMNAPAAEAEFRTAVSRLNSADSQSIRNFEVWVANAVFGTSLSGTHSHNKFCSYQEVVAFYESLQ